MDTDRSQEVCGSNTDAQELTALEPRQAAPEQYAVPCNRWDLRAEAHCLMSMMGEYGISPLKTHADS